MYYSGTVTVPGRHPSGINCLTNAMKSTFMPYKPLHVYFELDGAIFLLGFQGAILVFIIIGKGKSSTTSLDLPPVANTSTQ